MEPDFQSESWEQTGPFYGQSYVVSAFLLIGLLSIAWWQVPLTSLTLVFFGAWFGGLVYWLIQNRRAERTFASDRITIAGGRVAHTFRYAITEVAHSEITVAELKEMKVYAGDPIAIELIGENDDDFFMLPNLEAVARLEATLLKQNPNIAVSR